MRKHFFYPIILLLGIVLSFVSCANCEEETNAVIETAISDPYEDMTMKIYSIQIPENCKNKSLGLQESAETRGPGWKVFWKWFRVVMSDALGGVKNTKFTNNSVCVGVSISTSIRTYKEFKRRELEAQLAKLNPQKVTSANSGGPTPILNDSTYWKSGTDFGTYPGSSSDATAHLAGYYHNQIITDLYNEYGNSMLDMPAVELDSLISLKIEYYNEHTGLQYNTESCDTVAVNFVTDVCMNSEILDQCIQTFIQTYPEMSSEFQVIKAIFERLEEIDFDEDNGDFAAEATYVIGNANVPAEVKNRLETILSISNASIRLWNFEVTP